MRWIILLIIALIALPIVIIVFKHRKQTQDEEQDQTLKIINSGIFVPPGEKLRQQLAEEQMPGLFPTTAYRNPELEEAWEKVPAHIYYYNPETLSEEQQQLLFGTGTVPIYGEQEEGPTYPFPTAPVYESQLQHNVSKPNRYDYISRWESFV